MASNFSVSSRRFAVGLALAATLPAVLAVWCLSDAISVKALALLCLGWALGLASWVARRLAAQEQRSYDDAATLAAPVWAAAGPGDAPAPDAHDAPEALDVHAGVPVISFPAAHRQASLATTASAVGRAEPLLDLVGHQLRNPLNAMAAATEVIKLAGGVGPLDVEASAILERQVHRMARTIDDVLDIARLQVGAVSVVASPLELAGLARRAVDALSGRAPPLSVIEADLQAVWVQADAGHLTRVLHLLLAHACRRAGGDGRVALRVAPLSEHAVIEVRDGGEPVPRALWSYMLDPFASVEPARQDMPPARLSLEMILVGRLVRLIGGEVSVESDDDGTRVAVRLVRHANPPAPSDAQVRRRARSVLLTLHDPTVLRRLAQALSQEGHTVATVADGRSCLDQLLSYPPQIAVVGTDLPDLPGLELAKRSRVAGFAGRLIALAPPGASLQRVDALRAGFDALLILPVDPAQMAQAFED